MMILLQIILLVVGFFLLIKGADIFVDGASAVATNFRMPKILIGLTIVAFGTSAPEFAVSVKSLLSGNGDIVLGNVIGSNILNILLILGCCAMVHSLKVKRDTVRIEIPMTVLLTTLLCVLLSDNLFDWSVSGANVVNAFTRSDGLVVVMFFAIFLYYLFSVAKNKKVSGDELDEKVLPLGKAILFTALGIIAIMVGSEFVVDSATYLATAMHVSEKMIALTIVALGTSLPELVTGITATRKGEYDLALGNVVGSNIFNIGIVLGLPVAFLGGIYHISFNYIDLCVMVLAAVMLFIFASNDRKITRREGTLFLILFAAYYAYTIVNGLTIS